MDKSSLQRNLALKAIRKKLVGKPLSYKEIYAIMDEIAKQKLGGILTAYFAASGYSNGFSNEELYFLTKAMVETGEQLHFKGIVADKHSIGGIPGTRTTLVVVPIVAAAGFTIPKSSSRAITTPGGTADDMEVLAPVEFSKQQIHAMVEKVGGCIVWGGSFNIAPADDELIQVEEPLMFESYDKIVVSIMAKKIAFGSNHVIIDIPYGETAKLHRIKDAEILKEKFEYLAKKFNVTIACIIHKTDEPFGRGIGPILETREAMKVLEQTQDRPLDLENKSLLLAGALLDLCLKDSPKKMQEEVKKKYKDGLGWATDVLQKGHALKKMQQIIHAQGGKSPIKSGDLKVAKHCFEIKTKNHGTIKKIDINNITILAKILGAPRQKSSGIFLNKKIGEDMHPGDTVCTFYSENVYNLKEAKDSYTHFPIFKV